MNLISFCGHTFDESRLPEAPRVLDVGARNFDFSRAILEIRPQARILAMEPDEAAVTPESFLQRKNNRIWTALVGDGRRAVEYISFSTGEGNYVREPGDTTWYDDWTLTDIRACDIREITTERWDLVKLDCEGSEFGILENWPRGGIAAQISVEFHDYKDLKRWDDAYFQRLWTLLPEYEVVRHPFFKQGQALGHWDSLLIRKEGL